MASPSYKVNSYGRGAYFSFPFPIVFGDLFIYPDIGMLSLLAQTSLSANLALSKNNSYPGRVNKLLKIEQMSL